MKVYIVERYLDYDETDPTSIDKIFLSEDKAKEYVKAKNEREKYVDPCEKMVYQLLKGIEVDK